MHQRLEIMMTDKKLSDLPYEELMQKIREIRNGRIIPQKEKKIIRKSTERVRKSKASAFVDALSPEQKLLLLEKLKGSKP